MCLVAIQDAVLFKFCLVLLTGSLRYPLIAAWCPLAPLSIDFVMMLMNAVLASRGHVSPPPLGLIPAKRAVKA